MNATFAVSITLFSTMLLTMTAQAKDLYSSAKFNRDIELNDYSWWHGKARGSVQFSEGALCKFETKASGKVKIAKGNEWSVSSIVTFGEGFYYFDKNGDAQQGETVAITLAKGQKSHQDQVAGIDTRKTIQMTCRTDFDSKGHKSDIRFIKKYFGLELKMNDYEVGNYPIFASELDQQLYDSDRHEASEAYQRREAIISADPKFFENLRTKSRGVQ